VSDLTFKQRFVSILLAITFNGTPLIIGIAMGELMNMIILFVLFAITNTVMDKKGYKNHAEITKTGEEWQDLAACYFTSNMLLLACLAIIRFNSSYVSQWQIVVLSAIIVVVSTISLSSAFLCKINESIETKKTIRNELKKMSKVQAKDYLYERLPEDEAEALFWLDFECKDLEFVAFNKINVSASTLKNLRRSAYERLRHINKSLD